MADWIPPEVAKTEWTPPEVSRATSIVQLPVDDLPSLPGLQPGGKGSFSALAGNPEKDQTAFDSFGADTFAKQLPGASSPRDDLRSKARRLQRKYNADPLGTLKDDFAPEAAAVVDMVSPWGVVGMLGGAGTGIIADVAASLQGFDRKQAGIIGLGVAGEVNQASQLVTNTLRYFTGNQNPSNVEEAMGILTEGIANGTDWLEETSNGRITSEEGQLLVQAVLGRLGAKAYGWDGKGPAPAKVRQELNESVESILGDYAKPTPEPAAPARYPTLEKAGFTIDGEPLGNVLVKPAKIVSESGVPLSRQSGKIDEKVLIGLGVGGAAAAVVVPIILDYLEGKTKQEEAAKLLEKSLKNQPSNELDPGFRPRVRTSGEAVPMPGAPASSADPMKTTPPKLRPDGSNAKEFLDWVRENPAALTIAALPLAAALKLDPKTSLKDIHGQLEYSTKVLTDLSESMGNKAEFTREHILQRANRPDVSKFEKEMFQDIVKDRSTISAKELVAEVKQRTGDFELKAAETDSFAEYGLSAIGRKESISFDDAGGEFPGAVDVPQARTTVYESPLELGDANHFGAPNYFAHARSFDEGGVRHVVEIQSDLAQKAGKALTPEERVNLENALDVVAAQQKILEYANISQTRTGFELNMPSVNFAGLVSDLERINPDVALILGRDLQTRFSIHEKLPADEALQRTIEQFEKAKADEAYGPTLAVFRPLAEVLRSFNADLTRLAAEHTAKLAQNKSVGPIRPMLKDWYKRVVREEIAETQKARQRIAEHSAKIENEIERRTTPQPWTQSLTRKLESTAYDLRVLSADVRNEHVSPGVAREYMLKTIESLPPEAQQRWKNYWENSADETGDFLQNPEGWGSSGSPFPKVLADFITSELGQVDVTYPRESQQKMPENKVRFATADTVAKVEGWPKQTVYKEDAQIEVPALRGLKTSGSSLGRTTDFISNGTVFVQDGVLFESGNWVDTTGRKLAPGEIRSNAKALQGVDLTPLIEKEAFRPEHQGIYDRYQKDIEKFLTRDLGAKPYTDPQGHTWLEVTLPEGPRKPTHMLGGGDPAAIAYLAAVGGSAALAAYLTDNDLPKEDGTPRPSRKLRNAGISAALVGAAGLLALRKSTSSVIAAAAEKVLVGLEDAAGNLSYQLEKISQPATRALREYDRQIATKTHDRLQKVAGWVESLRDLGDKNAVNAALLSGDWKAAVDAVPVAKRLEFARGLVAALDVIKETGVEAKAAGLLKKELPNYFPRRVADYPGLMEYLGQVAKTYIEKLVREAELVAEKKSGGALSDTQRATIFNNALRQFMKERATLQLPPHLKNRTVGEINLDMAKFYESASESLVSYIRSVTASVEQARFFGKNLVNDPATGAVNLRASIGNVFADAMANGKMDMMQFQEASRLLQVRFGPGEKSMGRLGRAVAGGTTAALLANPFSATMNLQDVASNVAVHSLLPTVKAVAQTLTKRADRITTADVGLANIIGEEFVGGASTPVTVAGRRVSMAKFVDKSMKLAGFQLLDMFGKEVTLNAAVNKARAQIKSRAGDVEFTRRNKDYFDADLAQLKDDLRAGRKTDLTLEYAFRQLADMQVITRSEMPTMALNNPKARLFWQMKHFAIKQLTLLRRRGIDEIRNGNVKQGTEFLLRYSLIVGAAGASMDYIVRSLMGHDEELELGDIPEQALKNFGMSQMLIEKVQQGKLAEATALLVAPPAAFALRAVEKPEDFYQYIPVIGKFLYKTEIMPSGLTRAQEQDEKQRKRDELREKQKLQRELGVRL